HSPTGARHCRAPVGQIAATGDSTGDEVVCSVPEVGRERIAGNTVSRLIRTRIVQRASTVGKHGGRLQRVPGTDTLEVVGAGTVGPNAPRRKAGLTTGGKGITRVRYGLSWAVATVIYGGRRSTDDDSAQPLLDRK